MLTDQISDVLYTTERSAQANLVKEGIDPSRIQFVGNVMIDSLRANLPHAVAPAQTLTLHAGSPDIAQGATGYAVVTLHRPSNVDDEASLRKQLAGAYSRGFALILFCSTGAASPF